MDYSSSLHRTTRTLPFLPFAVKPKAPHSLLTNNFTGRRSLHRSLVVARAGPSHCEFSSSPLNTPIELNSAAGKFLSSVLQNQRQFFNVAVSDELKQLADDRDAAVTRMLLSSGSDEASLHRRIAQSKEHECQTAVEDVMYMLIFYKFCESRVPLVPKLSRCIYNGRLEIWPSKVWELESIHSLEVLEMIREHISTVIGLRANSSVTDNWATTQIRRLHLGRVYAASILYGYFLKSASLRHHLECSLALAHQDLHVSNRNSLQLPEMWPGGMKNIVFGRINNLQSVALGQGSTKLESNRENLKCYVMGFDSETLQRCAKLKFREGVNLIEKHSLALFGDEKGLLVTDEVISTSFSSLKRLVLEAIAFGSFLWDTEEYVNCVYKLQENRSEG
ncbi:UV-B-induced protein At3g17800, chloroplastic-like [Mangifera indica]|uniref:UV-B-induced protein At3g17800, chloroplastic-like n=1 Tax=Mangifera indica TaxID=29780 RepID=UPI001CF987B6|nr:UV-B-induced protein At3g17800, chloroplastic-like [Mangifera indica]